MEKISKINQALNKITNEFNGVFIADSTKQILESLELTVFEFQNLKNRLRKISVPKLERKEKPLSDSFVYFNYVYQNKKYQVIMKAGATISLK